MADLLPLFPLNLVLFPGASLPLHIFEPRYKEMIGLCLEQKSSFGIVLVQESSVCRTGCTAEIVKVVQTYDDGRMDILTAGQKRFRVTDLNEELDYLRGTVEFIEDESGTAPTTASRALLIKFYEQCYFLLHGHPPDLLDFKSPLAISYQIANELPLDLSYKQTLLELLDEGERQSNLLKHLTLWVPQLQERERVRKRAGGNGHG
ncbi:MAG: LON peptidase substrate-binding domain-containing protein [Acidobacteria bacterium]|nr:LON peptidase substrate-binding domain-containing protein [Acidobacteriota bacterium]